MEAATRRAQDWLDGLGAAIDAGNYSGAADKFAEDSYWRDLVSFTWNIVTMEGREGIRAMLEARADDTAPSNWQVEGEATEADGVTEAWFSFETGVSRGRGQLRLQGDLGWTILTTMDELKGHEEKTGEDRVRGVEHGVVPGRKTWLEQLDEERATLGYEQQPEVVIIGGGQGGIALGARLRRLDVPTIILEKNERAGDSWRNRYKSLCLHDPVWYDHLPYLPFPDHWPVFAPKDKIADWLESYTKIMELNYWTKSEATSASYDEDTGEWTIHVRRDGDEVVLRPKQLVLATGMSGLPNVPEFPGADTFQGEIHHSSRHRDSAQYAGKRCVVMGSNNSAHDICAALWENGADVTMIQRTSTHIARSETLMELALGDLYSERALAAGITTNTADMIFASIPYRIMHTFQVPVYEEMARQDADFYQALEDAGFMLDWGDDGSGLFMKYLRRASGYYIDVGASQLIIDGKVKLESDTTIERINEHSVTLTNGTELPADLIVLATGYGSMNGFAAKIISQEVADKVGKVWGLGSGTTKDPGPWEGEERNMWKPTKQDGLWFHGGNLHQSRHYSQFLSLQFKARYEGIPTPVYGMGEVHHLS
ncbi:MAG: NAD(P)-binding domain-containing protein [Ilumatobacter sp.]|uniref:NAD(P)-binding domain-containing protein n=1 Tax=Ilumatobacter sp. TaxID=1967498 RepID=UPI00261E7817|nr:NAD(P)-binding domain-containing protein [Ilumatobacter sp.]MDJ0768315.1 NAD(P)-binding domain-containing protein [Ilumatobacter sp.]